MILSIFQTFPQFAKTADNLLALETLLQKERSDVVILPELCTSGYSFLSPQEAFENSLTADDFAAFLMPFCEQDGKVIVAGFAERYEDKVYNSAIFVSADGNFAIYRKTHLFYKERFCFQEGNTGFITLRHPNLDAKIGLMICYDWRFPESARTLALQGADLIACPSNLITNVSDIGMKARALENSVFVATANRVGTEERTLADGSLQQLTFTGKSALYTPNGSALATADAQNPDLIRVEIDIQAARNKAFNEFNDIFKDRRPEFYNLG
jgi:predicted amidohydrolase